MGRTRAQALASVAALGLICALGAGAGGSAAAPGDPVAAKCGDGYPKPPPKRYRFRISGHTTSGQFWGDGVETYLYRGVMKRMRCRGTHVEYWQTKGRVSQTFKNISVGPSECDFTGYPPHTGIGNSPTRTRRLKRFEVDVGFVWIGDEYQTSVINPNNGQLFAHGTVRCPNPPAANGSTVPFTFRHVSSDIFFKKGVPRRVVKGKVVNYLDPRVYRFWINWKLTAIR